MPLTTAFRDTVKARAERDPAFRAALLREAVQAMLEGDLTTAKALLRDTINATTGFPALGRATGVNEKSLMRMYGPSGNPTAANLLRTLAALQATAAMEVTVVPRRGTPRRGGRLAA